jgi:hypothetical protein
MGEDLLRFAKDWEVFIYLILGILIFWQIRKFAVAWGELRGAAFGLERESAQAKLNWSISMLIFVFLVGVVEFGLVSFVVPNVPEASPLPTSTLDLLATPTITLEPGAAAPQSEASPLSVESSQNTGCVPLSVDIISPANGETIRDIVEIIGSSDIPNFGFYKFEMSPLNDPTWLTIQAGDVITREGRLGYWDTTRLPPGDYALQLVVTDNQGQAAEPCVIEVRVEPPSETE